MVARLGGNLTSRKKFLALPASKKFHINHREATSSTWLGRGAEGGTRAEITDVVK